MITIEKGDSRLIVTRGQFENDFKKLGYHEVYETFDTKEVVKENTTSFNIKEKSKEKGKLKESSEINAEEKEQEELDKKFGFSGKSTRGRKAK